MMSLEHCLAGLSYSPNLSSTLVHPFVMIFFSLQKFDRECFVSDKMVVKPSKNCHQILDPIFDKIELKTSSVCWLVLSHNFETEVYVGTHDAR